MGIAGNFPLTIGELGLDLVGTGYPQLGHADVELHEGEQRVGAACLYMEHFLQTLTRKTLLNFCPLGKLS